jgi:hypothetical protein
MSLALFALVIFQIESSSPLHAPFSPGPASHSDPPTFASCVAGITVYTTTPSPRKDIVLFQGCPGQLTGFLF